MTSFQDFSSKFYVAFLKLSMYERKIVFIPSKRGGGLNFCRKLPFIDLTDLMPTDRLLWEYAHLLAGTAPIRTIFRRFRVDEVLSDAGRLHRRTV